MVLDVWSQKSVRNKSKEPILGWKFEQWEAMDYLLGQEEEESTVS